MYSEKTLNYTSVKQLLKTYAQLLRKHKIALDKMYLYGSYAKGKPSRWSDIDVVVISPDFDSKSKSKNEDALWNLRSQLDVRISPLAYSPREWDKEISIKNEVETYGIEIYS